MNCLAIERAQIPTVLVFVEITEGIMKDKPTVPTISCVNNKSCYKFLKSEIPSVSTSLKNLRFGLLYTVYLMNTSPCT